VTAPGCLSPASCPVPDPSTVDLRRLRLTYLELNRRLFRVHSTGRPELFNTSGVGSQRFSPLALRGHCYLGDTQTVALLETVFHEVHATRPRVVYAATALAGRTISAVTVTRRLPLIDLRDDNLARIGLERSQLVATTPAHYPCTRQWAERFVTRRIGGQEPVGWLWNSRVAELAGAGNPLLADLMARQPSEVCVVFAPPTPANGLRVTQSSIGDLRRGQARLLVDQIAEHLDAEIH